MTVAGARLDELGARMKSAERVTVLTGAGVSAASGVPTFRGAGGLWRSFRSEDLATLEAFDRDPQLVWEWYDWRRTAIAVCEPNAAHHVIARWSRRSGFTLVTQNVDGLHERAGSASVLRMHGSIWELRCRASCTSQTWEDHRAPLPDLPPRCPACGGLARPGVVWFGELLDPDVLARSIEATRCDVFFAVGTSALVHPAAGLIARAKAHGAYTVEINPEPTEGSRYLDMVIPLGAEHALPILDTRTGC
jgi:NAD-dependent deacetylase